ncbi:GntR family transcriptional regulator [Bordetella ansorpii]|uniref:GntR family transcriptional regulator n=1 Tax=Bordetella ansorpii TaxID=288768 RepID=A0A157QX76_9BORD|nr:FCD domain-containing protein [Bordetella ansorpii]SAI50423.1 GntR family transcriptional regulator [Bordetella ansorpii]
MSLRTSTLTDQVASQLAAEIARGTYAVGAKLPAGKDLASLYGVSAAVIREATERLRAQGLVRSRQGSGCVVLARTGAAGFQVSAEADRAQLAHVYELRMELEGGAAALAARRRTLADLAAMQLALEGLRGCLDDPDPDAGVEYDVAFHSAVAVATHNPSYQRLLQYLNLQLRQAVRTARQNSLRHAGLPSSVQQEHLAMFDAISRGDADGARAAAVAHLRGAAGRLELGLPPIDSPSSSAYGYAP